MNIKTTWDWKTHQPMIHLMMLRFNPEFVMELGVGFNSTPLFLDYYPKQFICIENDKEWLDKIVDSFPFCSNYSARFHPVSTLNEPIDSGTKPSKLSDEKKREIATYYIDVKREVQEEKGFPKLLFVDNYTCLRAVAISMLGTCFDIVIYHDCQLEGIAWYGYYFGNQFDEYDFYILKTSSSWTGCYISKKLPCEEQELREMIQPYIQRFCTENNLKLETVWLEKQKR